jgi:hypothetical protein
MGQKRLVRHRRRSVEVWPYECAECNRLRNRRYYQRNLAAQRARKLVYWRTVQRPRLKRVA